ncbi:MAG TPA: 50S ribosomal protein L25/general stress protein Ctc [Candidatus Binatia bacterium]|nr:50S ribosomal protein L25/general stress protein Ctc [Candidatus Binatia bacterium]
MKEAFVVNAEVRADAGKGASRRLRRTGKVPAIIYGGKEPPQSLALNHHEMARHLETEAFYSHILTLKLDGKEQQAVLKDVQRHPANPVLLHFDFQRVFADQPIRMHVPLHFKDAEKSPGVKTEGGVVEHYLIQVEVECLPKDLPEFIDVDMSQMKLNDSVHLSQLKLPAGVVPVELKHKKDSLVVAVHVPRKVEEEAPVAEVAPGEVPATAVKAEGEAPAAGGKPGEAAKPGAAPAGAKPEGKDDKKK